MPNRITSKDVTKRLARCKDLADYCELIRKLLAQRSIWLARRVAERGVKHFPGEYQTLYDDLGICEWLLGNHDRAIEAWRAGLTTPYRDAAYGMYTRLLLWYAGAMNKSAELIQEAESHIQHALKTGWASNWPAPIGRFLLGRASEEDILSEASTKDARYGYDLVQRETRLFLGASAARQQDFIRARSCFERCATGLQAALKDNRSTELYLGEYSLKLIEGRRSGKAKR